MLDEDLDDGKMSLLSGVEKRRPSVLIFSINISVVRY